MFNKSTLLALGALLLCSACADATTKSASLMGGSSMQVTSVNWDETVAPAQPAKVINASLIFMR